MKYSLVLGLLLACASSANADTKILNKDPAGVEVYVDTISSDDAKATAKFAKVAKKHVACPIIGGRPRVARLVSADINIDDYFVCAACPPGKACLPACKMYYHATGIAKVKCSEY